MKVIYNFFILYKLKIKNEFLTTYKRYGKIGKDKI